MMNKYDLLRVAIENNIAWCSTVCAVHGSNESSSPIAWTNLATSPRYYPNIITRRRSANHEVSLLAEKVREANPSAGWGIKDSFGDLTLSERSFERLLVGNWYAGTVSCGDTVGWETVASPTELRAWEEAWGASGDTIFPCSLLNDDRIKFWFTGGVGAIRSGFISFSSGFSLGLSNWFSIENHSFDQIGLLTVAGSAARGLPIVCWSKNGIPDEDMSKLGPLQVWIAT